MPKFPLKHPEIDESSSEEDDEQVDESGSDVDEEVALDDVDGGVVDEDAVPKQKVEIDNTVRPARLSFPMHTHSFPASTQTHTRINSA